MIENHQNFHYQGYVDCKGFVLYVFDEGIHVQPKGPVRTQRPSPKNLPCAQEECLAVLMSEFDSLTAADVGWNPGNADSCWGHVARPLAARKKLALCANPTESRDWADTIRQPSAPDDPVFCWNPKRLDRTELRICNKPMVRVGDPRFDHAHDRATVDALLAQAGLALAWQRCEIAGAHELLFKGYLPAGPGRSPTLVFDRGVWIPQHEDLTVEGFYPGGTTVTVNQAREEVDLEDLRTRLADPSLATDVLNTFRQGWAALGATAANTVLVDMVDPAHPVVRNLGKGYLPSGSAAADPVIDDVAALRTLMQGHYAPCKNPDRVLFAYQIDRCCRWDARDAMAVIKAALYHRLERSLPAGSAHSIVWPFIENFCHQHAALEASMLKNQCVSLPFATLLEHLREDTRMATPLKLRLDSTALLAWLTSLGFQKPVFTPFAKPAITREALCLRHALVRLHAAGTPVDSRTLVYIDHMGQLQLDGEQLTPDAAVTRLGGRCDRLIDFIALS